MQNGWCWGWVVLEMVHIRNHIQKLGDCYFQSQFNLNNNNTAAAVFMLCEAPALPITVLTIASETKSLKYIVTRSYKVK